MRQFHEREATDGSDPDGKKTGAWLNYKPFCSALSRLTTYSQPRHKDAGADRRKKMKLLSNCEKQNQVQFHLQMPNFPLPASFRASSKSNLQLRTARSGATSNFQLQTSNSHIPLPFGQAGSRSSKCEPQDPGAASPCDLQKPDFPHPTSFQTSRKSKLEVRTARSRRHFALRPSHFALHFISTMGRASRTPSASRV